jgi:polysaccharide biosynthesis/export protein
LRPRYIFAGVAVFGCLGALLLAPQKSWTAGRVFAGALQAAQPVGSSTQDKTATQDKDKDSENDKDKQKVAKKLSDKAGAPDTNERTTLTDEQRETYVIGVEDELQISVWREPELSTNVVVRPDGLITLPLVNDVKAAGLKTDELQNLLMEKLKGFVNEPQVTVIVRSIRSRKVYLVGEVGHQGTFSLNGDMTALELLALAGGVGPFAKADSIYILREENGKKIRIPFHYKKAVAGKSENVVLKPGDLVVVP